MLEVTITTLPYLTQPDHEVEFLLEWTRFEGTQAKDGGGFDSTRTIDLREESLLDFIAQCCVDFARDQGQSSVMIAFPKNDVKFRNAVNPVRLAEQIGRLSDGTVDAGFRPG